jgi:hypothetical protein
VCFRPNLQAHHYYKVLYCKLLKLNLYIKCQFTFQDPFGEERGTFQYRNILTRLQALHAKLSAKCNNVRTLGDKTTSDECSSDESDLDQPDEPPGLVSSWWLRLPINLCTSVVSFLSTDMVDHRTNCQCGKRVPWCKVLNFC